jgi:hypothetical protein
MDIEKLLNEYEADQAQKKREAEAAALAKEKERADEIIRRQGNASVIERHLKEVVYPIFLKVQGSLEAKGLKFSVEETALCDPILADKSKTFAIRMKLKQARLPSESGVFLEFEGEFQSVMMSVSEHHATGRPIREAPLPLSSITHQYVEERVEKFLRIVLGLNR